MSHSAVDLLKAAVSSGASDLHLTVGAPPSVRVNGDIVPLDSPPLDADSSYKIVMSVLNDSQRARLEENLELDFAVKVEGVGRFRGNAHFNRGSLEAVYRYINEEIPTFSHYKKGVSIELVVIQSKYSEGFKEIACNILGLILIIKKKICTIHKKALKKFRLFLLKVIS